MSAKLEGLDAYCKTVSGTFRYLSGERMSAVDCRALPTLYHIEVAGKMLKGYTIPDELVHLAAYKSRGFASKSFIASAYPHDAILDGWTKHIGACALE